MSPRFGFDSAGLGFDQAPFGGLPPPPAADATPIDVGMSLTEATGTRGAAAARTGNADSLDMGVELSEASGIARTGSASPLDAGMELAEATGRNFVGLGSFDEQGQTVEVLAVVIAERSTTAGIVQYYRAGQAGSLTAGSDLALDQASLTINRIRSLNNGATLLLNRSSGAGTVDWSTQFEGADPTYGDATFTVQTLNRTIQITVADDLDDAGGGYIRFDVDDQADSGELGSIATGDRFILAMTVPPPARAGSASPLNAGMGLAEATGTRGSATARDGSAAALNMGVSLAEASGTRGAASGRTGNASALGLAIRLTAPTVLVHRIGIPTPLDVGMSLTEATGTRGAAAARTGNADTVTAGMSLSAASGVAATPPANAGDAAPLAMSAAVNTATGTADVGFGSLDPRGQVVEVLALIDAGRAVSGTDVEYYREGITGTAVAGSDLTLDQTDITINRFRIRGGTQLLLHSSGNGQWSDFFEGSPPVYQGATFVVQTRTRTMRLTIPDDLDDAGGGFIRLNIPTDDQPVINMIEAGHRFLLAVTSVPPQRTGTATPTDMGMSLGEATGIRHSAGARTGSAQALDLTERLSTPTTTRTVIARTGDAQPTDMGMSLGRSEGLVDRYGSATAVRFVLSVAEASGVRGAAGSHTGSALALDVGMSLSAATGTRTAAAARTGNAVSFSLGASLAEATGMRGAAGARTGSASSLDMGGSLSAPTGTRTEAAARTGTAASVDFGVSLTEATGTRHSAGARPGDARSIVLNLTLPRASWTRTVPSHTGDATTIGWGAALAEATGLAAIGNPGTPTPLDMGMSLTAAAGARALQAGGPPSVPRYVRAVAESDNTALLTWTAPADAGGAAISRYEAQVTHADGSMDPWEDIGLAGEYRIRGLGAGYTYSIRLRAVSNVGIGTAAPQVSITAHVPQATEPPASAVEIPLLDRDNQTVIVRLNNVDCRVHVWWQPLDGAWYATLEAPINRPVAAGRRLTTGVDLLDRTDALAGKLLCWPTSVEDGNLDPVRTAWSRRSHLLVYAG